jgi:hypothetical protein
LVVNKVGGVSHLESAENGDVIAKKIIATRVIAESHYDEIPEEQNFSDWRGL